MNLTDSGLLTLRPEGVYCPEGDFYIDPWRPVSRAVVTHGHSDHARWGCNSYVCATTSKEILRHRLGEDIRVQAVEFGEKSVVNGVTLSLHPAGHILGSAQVRVERNGEVAVVTGDYKREPDATCEVFEPVEAHCFISESTFGLPIYRWEPQELVAAAINRWWSENADRGVASVLLGYALGKSQRLLAMVDPSIGPIVTHGSVAPLNAIYRNEGIPLPLTKNVLNVDKADLRRALVIAPPSALGTPWMKRFGEYSDAFASGWMTVRGARRRRSVDRGFVVSDHVDWPSLLQSVDESKAERVWVTHGYSSVVARYLQETRGLDARVLSTEWEGESMKEEAPAEGAEQESEGGEA